MGNTLTSASQTRTELNHLFLNFMLTKQTRILISKRKQKRIFPKCQPICFSYTLCSEVENSVIYLEVCFLENRICNLNNAYAGINLFILAQSPMELLLLEHCHVLHNPLQDNNWENWEGAQVKEAAFHPSVHPSIFPSIQSVNIAAT